MDSPKGPLASRIGQAVAFALVLFATTAVPVLADSPPEGGGESAWLTEIPAPNEAEVAAAEGAQRERTEWLSSPEADHQRQASRNAYTNLSTAEAQSLLFEAFPAQIKQLNEDPARVLSGLEIEKPLGTYAARVEAGEGESAILSSSTPVESDVAGEGLEPVDLTLERSGDSFVPQNPVTEAELPSSVEEPIQLQGGIEVELPASDDHGAEPLGDMNLFYPETETATDTLVAPRASGVEVFEQLRSPESPERFSFAMNLPGGATLQPSEGGGVEVVTASGETIEEVPPPSATDTQGATVPVTTTIEGDSLVLEVPHRSREVAYPVLLDPNYVNDGTSFGEWVPSLNSGYEYPLRNLGSSLNAISKGSNYYYAPNTHGQWAYGAYGETAYIAAATFSPIYFLVNNCYTAQPHGYIGLYNVNSGAYDSLGIYSGGTSENSKFETGWKGGTGTRAAILGVGTDGAGAQNACAHELYVGGYSIQEKDPYPPSVSVSGVPSGWFDPAKAGNATVNATDTGLGVHWISMEESGGGSVHPEINCNGANGSRCSRERSWALAPPYKPGQRTLQVTAEDPVENVGKWTTTTKVDTVKPEINLGSQFAFVTEETGLKGEENEASENVLRLPVYNLRIEATDGNEKGPATEWQSGVKNIEIFLDGTKQSVPWGAQGCTRTESSCPMVENYQVKLTGLGAGVHKLKILAGDQVGLAREREIEFEYIPSTGMKDEYVMQHFPLPDGEGNESEEENPIRPELAVNVMNGNLVYRQKDLEVTGPSVDLEVERFYNSQLPKEDNTEWGAGWTLAQTPVLEPEESKGSPPNEAMALQESGTVESQVQLPTKNGEEVFDKGIQAVVTKEPGGYEVADQSGDSTDAVAYNESGEATELRTKAAASVEYERKGSLLAEISVEDPSVVPGGAKKAALEEAANEPAVYLEQFGSSGTGNGQFQHPGDVAASSDGGLWVADTYGHRLEKFNSKGEFLLQVTNGSGKGETMHPSGVSTDAAGNVYEADWSDSGVYEYSSSGAFIRKIGAVGSGQGQVYGPEDMAVDAKGNIIVADTGNGRLVEFNSKGEFVRNMGTKGTGAEQLGEPTGIDVDAAGNVFVADWTNNKVMEYNEAGTYVRKWGEMGSGNSQFNRPDAIAVDVKGDVYVGDQENSSVKEFTATGEFIRKFGSKGSGPGQFSFAYPMGMDVDKAGSIWVTDPYNQRVERWAMARESNSSGAPGAQADPSVAITESGGLVSSVSGAETGIATYSHEAEKLTAVSSPNGETKYKYDSSKRLTKVELPHGTWAEIKYETAGRVSSITVVIEGGKAKTTTFIYSDEPRETTVTFETEPAAHYQIGPDGSVLKWWNAKVPPEIEELTGSLYTERGEVHPGPISSGDQTLNVKAHAWEGVASIQIVANGNDLIAEKNCEEAKCVKLEKELVTETQNWAPGILQLEVIVIDTLGQTSSQRFWDNIPYTPPPSPGALEPPKFKDILHFREEFGLDLDLKGNEQAINERIFELIAAWHDPASPAGEVARASNERWGEPMRPADIAEMEYREGYLALDASAIPLWAAEHGPSTFAGYYVDNRAGGIVHVGFTSGQAASVEAMKTALQASGTPATDRIEPYLSAPPRSLSTLGEMAQSVVAQPGAGTIRGVFMDEEHNRLEVMAQNVAAAEGWIASQFGSGAAVIVSPYVWRGMSGRWKTSGTLMAGDGIASQFHKGGNLFNDLCTAGFGVSEKVGGVYRRFLITAGHCSNAESAEWGRIAGPKDPNLVKIGTMRRNALAHEVDGFATDGAAITLDGLAPPRTIYPEVGEAPIRITGATVAAKGLPVCSSGAISQHTHHGNILNNDNHTGFIQIPKKEDELGNVEEWWPYTYQAISNLTVVSGDSGGPVWQCGTGKAIGLVGSANGHGLTGISTLLPPLPPEERERLPGFWTFKPDQAPGILGAPSMGNINLVTGG